MSLYHIADCLCCVICGTRWHFKSLQWTFAPLRCRAMQRVVQASLFTVLYSPLNKSPSVFRVKWWFNIISASEVARQLGTSGCIVTSGRCWPSAADEEWYTPKRPSRTVAVQHSSSRLLQRFCLLTKNLNKHGEKEAANTVHHRLAGPRYMLLPAEPIIITHCTSLEA